jgi:hypothetical protein
MTSHATDFKKLDDPAFIAARRRLREQLERLPEHHGDRATLVEVYQAMTDEFDRRARAAWTAG